MKQRKGCLVKRSSGYYISLMVDGARIVKALHNPDGTPAKTLQDARKAQADFARVFALGSKADATQAILARLSGIQNEIAEIQSPKPKVADCWQAYLKHPDKLTSGELTETEYKRYTRQFVEWMQDRYPETVYLQDVTRAIAGEYAKTLEARYNGCTFNKRLIFLRVLFRVLCEGHPNPFERVKGKPIDSTPHKPFSSEQIQKILGKANGEIQTLVIVGVYCALRLKDACLLKWSQVDLESGVITVKPSKTASRSGKVISIPMHPELKSRLETTFRKSEYVLPWVAWRYNNDRHAISAKIRTLIQSAGIQTQDAEGHTVYSYHSLRFTLGSALVSSGVSLEIIGQLLCHTNTTMSRHYSSIADTVKERAILSLPSITATATA